MPSKTKEKFNSTIKNYKDRLTKIKKKYSEFRIARNKLEKNEKNSKVQFFNLGRQREIVRYQSRSQ